MIVSVFGLGYVGCVSAACLAENGFNVIGVDVNPFKVDLINTGKPTIIEDGVDELVKNNWEKGYLKATTNYIEAVENTNISLICVGTPNNKNGQLDLKFVFETAKQIGETLKQKSGFHVIAIRSTVFPGTNAEVTRRIEVSSGKEKNRDFAVVSNPEFLREGSAIKDYFNPSITVLGSESETAIDTMKKLYEKVNAPVEIVSIKTAEFIKYVNNSFHALKISFANEVGNISKAMGIDSYEVMNLFIKDTSLNISPVYFKPGMAYGGSCLPKDLKGLVTIAHDNYIKSPLLESIEHSNGLQKLKSLEIIQKHNRKKVLLIGLAFKKGTDDLRFSPSVDIAEQLIGKGYSLKIFDEYVYQANLIGSNKSYIAEKLPHLTEILVNDLRGAIKEAEIIVITQNLSMLSENIQLLEDKIVLDFVRIDGFKQLKNYEGLTW